MPTARLDRLCEGIGNSAAEQNGNAGKDEQSQRVAKAPGQAVLDDVADVAAARSDAGDSCDVIGFERMLHAEQKTQT